MFGEAFEPFEETGYKKSLLIEQTQGGQKIELPLFWKTCNSEWRAFETRSYLIEGTQAVGLCFLDVTEKTILEEDLKLKNFYFERAEDIGLLGSWNSSPGDEGDLKWSANNYKIFGCDEKTFTPTVASFFEFIHPDDREKVRNAATQAITSGELYDVEHRIITPDGQIKWIHERGKIITGEGKRPTRFIGISQDITKRVNDKAALSTINQKFRVLFDSDIIGSFVTGPGGNVVECNNEYLRMTGFSREDLLAGRISWKNTVAENYSRSDEEWAQLHNGQVFPPMEMDYVNQDGVKFPVLVGATKLIEEDGKWIAFAFDLTEMKTLQRKISDVERLDALGLLAGGVAHDFNNILSVCMLYFEQLHSLEISSEAKAKVVLLQNHAERAKRLVQQLLTFSRNQVREPEPTSLDFVVGGMNEMIERLATEFVDIEITLGCDGALINADVAQLEQVILNLVTNARDAMERGGTLKIETSKVRLDEHNDTALSAGEYLLLKVSDTGIGMDSDTAKRVFEPFYSTKEFGKGTGLGLSTVYGIVKQSQGYVRVESQVGEGTTFYIYFPIWRGSAPALSIASSLPKAAVEAKILVVEDQNELRILISDILAKKGFTVTEASSGIEALDKFSSSNDFNLIITDVVMPKMSGPTLRQKLGKNVPVLYISGYANNELNRHGVDDRNSHFLAKPFSSAELLEKVYDTLRPQTY